MKLKYNSKLLVAALASCLTAGISHAALTSNLELYLPMDGNVADTSGNSATTSVNGTPAFSAGKVGQTISLTNPSPMGSATPQYVNAGAASNLNFGTTTDFSVQFWVNTTSNFPNNSDNHDDPGIVSNKDWNSGVNQGWFIGAGGNGRLQWNIGDGAGPAGRMDYDGPAGQINDGSWHHVVLSATRAGNIITYIDNSVVNTQGATSAFNIDTPAGFETRIGVDGAAGSAWAAYFPGDIDEVAIWSRALSAGEVATLYNNGDGMAIPEPSSAALLGLLLGFPCFFRHRRR